jgi:trehalose 6-phosphate synthase
VSRRLKESLQGPTVNHGVDHLDYSKGLGDRFNAFASFLERYHEHRGRARFLQIATATRSEEARRTGRRHCRSLC